MLSLVRRDSRRNPGRKRCRPALPSRREEEKQNKASWDLAREDFSRRFPAAATVESHCPVRKRLERVSEDNGARAFAMADIFSWDAVFTELIHQRTREM